ncbi:hypothetical protein AB0J20_00685 [Micromonospora costi]|uniref:hypothetical protein n=1 Tax=Micromonospora costi TaxID=1530042 RepID=UPI0033DA88B9
MTANRDIVSRAFADWSAGAGGITDLFAPDLRWEIVGNSASRTYHGAEVAWFLTFRDGKG